MYVPLFSQHFRSDSCNLQVAEAAAGCGGPVAAGSSSRRSVCLCSYSF